MLAVLIPTLTWLFPNQRSQTVCSIDRFSVLQESYKKPLALPGLNSTYSHCSGLIKRSPASRRTSAVLLALFEISLPACIVAAECSCKDPPGSHGIPSGPALPPVRGPFRSLQIGFPLAVRHRRRPRGIHTRCGSFAGTPLHIYSKRPPIPKPDRRSIAYWRTVMTGSVSRVDPEHAYGPVFVPRHDIRI